MVKRLHPAHALLVAGGILLGVAGVWAQQQAASEHTLLHVFAYAPLEKATPQDLENFNKVTAELVGKVPGLKRVWVGKLKAGIDAPDGKQIYGVGMEFEDEKTYAAYADHPAHKEWERVYRRVRVAGTTTIDLIGQ